MQLPSNVLLSYTRPSRYLPALELIWCVLTVIMACVQSVENVYVIRFLLGLAEAGFYPGVGVKLSLFLYETDVFIDCLFNWYLVYQERVGEKIGFINYFWIIWKWIEWCCTGYHAKDHGWYSWYQWVKSFV